MIANSAMRCYTSKIDTQTRSIVMYIHQQKEWPNFRWDHEKIQNALMSIRFQQGRLIGGMRTIGFHITEQTVLETLTQDVVKSSEIEGEILNKTQVRSSVARHLGVEFGALSTTDRNVDGIVELVLDAIQNYEKPLTKERLFDWHKKLFPFGQSGFSKISVGAWRKGPVQVVSGHTGRERVHFEGPESERLELEIERFLHWYNHEASTDFVLKAAVAHLWFVTIHPFEDGNGRIGRVLSDMLLARSEKSTQRFYSLSAQIQIERKSYYAILEKSQKGNLDITLWIEWFLRCLSRALDNALSTLNMLIQKSHFWQVHAETVINDRQRKIINLLLEGFKGKLTSSKWATITKCSQDTAYRDILDLVKKRILEKSAEGGRSTSYCLVTCV